jgi:lysophospholipase L1-like esterase
MTQTTMPLYGQFHSETGALQGFGPVGSPAVFFPLPVSPHVVALGDSLTQYFNHFMTPTSAVRSGNVVTVNFTAHGLGSGSRIDVYGFKLNPDFNTRDATITRIDANNFSYPSVGSDATATVDATYTRISYRNWFTNVSPFTFANSKLKGALTLVENFGQSSEQTSEILARINSVLASDVQWVIYLGGSNDVVSSTTAATTIANNQAIVDALLSAGKSVVLCTIPPLGVGHAQFATAMPKIVQINEALKLISRTTGGRVRLCDYFGALVNPLTGGAKVNALQTDNVHWQTYGARLAGTALAAAFTGIPDGAFLTTSIADGRETYAGAPNIWSVGQYNQVDAGTKSGPTNAASPPGGAVAGTLAGFNVTATAGAGEVWMGGDADGFGFSQVVSWTPSGAGTVTLQQQSAATMAAMVQPGERYRLGFHLKVTGVTLNLSFLRVRVQGVFDGVTQVIGTPMHSTVGASKNVFTDFDEYIIGPVMYIPPFTTCTSLTVEVIANFIAATTLHTITVSRVTMNKMV